MRGCTDSASVGYDSHATEDDGSCLTALRGCTVPSASNYDDVATIDDGSCFFTTIGCTDSRAVNFRASAVTDSGGCVYARSGCMARLAANYDSLANIDSGTCTYPIGGCMDSSAVNFAPFATVHGGEGCIARREGCMSVQASNYDSTATVHSDACVYPRAGCTDSESVNFDPLATVDSGSCIPRIPGCTDRHALNWDSVATLLEAGGCIERVSGCTDSRSITYNAAANANDGSCAYAGCTDQVATNHDPSATITDGSCKYASAVGQALALGPLRRCTVFVDASGDLRRDGDEANATTDGAGKYAVRYSSDGPLRLSRPGAWSSCEDSLTGQPVAAPLVTTTSASMLTPLTSVATVLVSESGYSTAEASVAVCAALMPCVPCNASAHLCDATTGCVSSCSSEGGEPLSVFAFDPLEAFLGGGDAAWLGWMTLQGALAKTLDAARDSLVCASPALCGNCSASCTSAGYRIGGHAAETVDAALYSTLAEMVVEGAVPLQSALPISEMINRTASRLGVHAKEADAIASSQAARNAAAYGVFTPSNNLASDPAARQLNEASSARAGTLATLDALCGAFSGGGPCGIRSGCLIERASNFDSSAHVDDGSCTIVGCADSAALNYDSAVTVHDPATCVMRTVGCMVPSAINYDSRATVQGASCMLPQHGCTRSAAENYRSDARVDDGTCRVLGCTNSFASNYAPAATVDDGSCTPVLLGCTDSQADNYLRGATRNDGSCLRAGCTDSRSASYDRSARFDDGSCGATVVGCLDSRAENYLPSATTGDSSACAIRGCTAPSATNYQSYATEDDGSCLLPTRGCTSSAAVNFDASASVDDGSCYIVGCTNRLALNFSPLATADDGSCAWPRRGCTDSRAENYDAQARLLDASCVFLFCLDSTATNYEGAAFDAWNTSRHAAHGGRPPPATVLTAGACTYPLLSPPSPPLTPRHSDFAVVVRLVVGGVVTDYDEASQHAVLAALAAAAGIEATAGASLTASAASVLFTATLPVPNEASAMAARTAFAVALPDPAAATALLAAALPAAGIVVEAVPEVNVVSTADAPPPQVRLATPPPTGPMIGDSTAGVVDKLAEESSGSGVGLGALIAIATIAATCIACLAYRWFSRAGLREVKMRTAQRGGQGDMHGISQGNSERLLGRSPPNTPTIVAAEGGGRPPRSLPSSTRTAPPLMPDGLSRLDSGGVGRRPLPPPPPALPMLPHVPMLGSRVLRQGTEALPPDTAVDPILSPAILMAPLPSNEASPRAMPAQPHFAPAPAPRSVQGSTTSMELQGFDDDGSTLLHEVPAETVPDGIMLPDDVEGTVELRTRQGTATSSAMGGGSGLAGTPQLRRTSVSFAPTPAESTSQVVLASLSPRNLRHHNLKAGRMSSQERFERWQKACAAPPAPELADDDDF